jgi:hypothetical protein
VTFLERCDLPAALEEAVQLGFIAEEHAVSSGDERQALSESMHIRLDVLIECLLSHCPADVEVTVAEVRMVLEQHRDLTEAALADLDMRVIPLAIIRELVSRHKLVVHKSCLQAWPTFAQRYRAVAFV